MKLNEFILESALVEMRSFVANNLFEDVNQYLSMALAKIKNKKPEEAFKEGDPNAVDLDHLTSIVIGLKILSNADHRDSMTKDDIGISPNDPKQFFKLLADVAKDGKDTNDVKAVFAKIAKLAPTAIKKQRTEFEELRSGEEAERKQVQQKLEQFILKVSQLYGKLRQAATTSASSGKNMNDVKTVGQS